MHITSDLPSQYSNKQQWNFTFECRDASPCTTFCSVHAAGTNPSFETCNGRFTATGFMNEEVLRFSILGIDSVGYMAPVISHTWTVGKIHDNDCFLKYYA